MTKTELKNAVMATGSHFFDRSSMRFFGDTMRNYYVPKDPVQVKTPSGNVHTCYELRRVHAVKHGLMASAFFDVETFTRVIPGIKYYE